MKPPHTFHISYRSHLSAPFLGGRKRSTSTWWFPASMYAEPLAWLTSPHRTNTGRTSTWSRCRPSARFPFEGGPAGGLHRNRCGLWDTSGPRTRLVSVGMVLDEKSTLFGAVPSEQRVNKSGTKHVPRKQSKQRNGSAIAWQVAVRETSPIGDIKSQVALQ